MKRRILIVCSVCFCMATSAYSQETTATIHETPEAVIQNGKLHALSDNIQAKEAALLQMTATSRAQTGVAADELNKLRQEYKALLTTEMEKTTSETALQQLRSELRYVESKLAVKSTR